MRHDACSQGMTEPRGAPLRLIRRPFRGTSFTRRSGVLRHRCGRQVSISTLRRMHESPCPSTQNQGRFTPERARSCRPGLQARAAHADPEQTLLSRKPLRIRIGSPGSRGCIFWLKERSQESATSPSMSRAPGRSMRRWSSLLSCPSLLDGLMKRSCGPCRNARDRP